ncbi:hypothetical protein AB0E59_41165 [Lentzea sp. NPDC034063]|uniref:hypothetical protein n=1 Tax=unclassified Lentzea TaxID=2643253 RepID=UPI0033C7B57D
MSSVQSADLIFDLKVPVGHSQIFIFSDEIAEPDDFEVAYEDGIDSGRYVGAAPGMIDLITPGTWNEGVPVRVEVWPAEPDSDTERWQHEVDVDLDVPDGKLVLMPGGDSSEFAQEIPAGAYRARVSGAGFTELADEGSYGDDYYRIRLWPRAAAAEPELRRCWAGWNVE